MKLDVIESLGRTPTYFRSVTIRPFASSQMSHSFECTIIGSIAMLHRLLPIISLDEGKIYIR
jgi:hypothetical protein